MKMSFELNEDDNLKLIEEEGFKDVKDCLKKMYDIWKEFGISTDQKSHRAKVVWSHVRNLLKDIYDEENTFYEETKERIKNYTSKIKELSSILSVTPSEPQGSLIKIEEILREELGTLIKLKNKLVKKYQELKKEEIMFCQVLNVPEHHLTSNAGVLSESDLLEYEQHIERLKEEKERRQKEFCMAKKDLVAIFESTELEPESTLERDILSGKETLPLTNKTFEALDEFVSRALKRKEELEDKRIDLVNKLSLLWQRLKMDENEREEFLSKHIYCRVSTINSIEQELQRLENIKKQNIGRFVSDLRIELEELWDKCHVSRQDRDLFHFFSNTDMSDEVLQAHEQEVEKWKLYYSQVEEIHKKIEKRKQLWDLMIVFENKATDPNRFKNRKGNLLKEEKERKKLQKDLPTLENEIFSNIDAFEAENGSPFFYNGEDFKSFVTNQWAERMNQKENEKIARQNKHNSQLKNEAVFGTPATKRPLMATPKTAPSKLLKSVMATPVSRTPASSTSRVAPSTIGKLPMKNSRLFPSRPNSAQKKVFRDKNKLNTFKSTTTSPNGTTYTDFASEMNSPARYNFRSSVLATKKPGGTRTSQTEKNRSKMKSPGKSLRKSMNKSKTNTNLTPARGKLGLPFLI